MLLYNFLAKILWTNEHPVYYICFITYFVRLSIYDFFLSILWGFSRDFQSRLWWLSTILFLKLYIINSFEWLARGKKPSRLYWSTRRGRKIKCRINSSCRGEPSIYLVALKTKKYRISYQDCNSNCGWAAKIWQIVFV